MCHKVTYKLRTLAKSNNNIIFPSVFSIGSYSVKNKKAWYGGTKSLVGNSSFSTQLKRHWTYRPSSERGRHSFNAVKIKVIRTYHILCYLEGSRNLNWNLRTVSRECFVMFGCYLVTILSGVISAVASFIEDYNWGLKAESWRHYTVCKLTFVMRKNSKSYRTWAP